jgi:hypothetical protein
MIRHQDQGPGPTPGEADTSPTLPLDAAGAPDPGTEPTVPLDAAAPPRAAEAGLGGAESASPARTDPEPSGYIGRKREHTDVDEHRGVDLARLAWLGTVAVCLIAVAILVVEGYYGYAAVTFAVAASAALNLS